MMGVSVARVLLLHYIDQRFIPCGPLWSKGHDNARTLAASLPPSSVILRSHCYCDEQNVILFTAVVCYDTFCNCIAYCLNSQSHSSATVNMCLFVCYFGATAPKWARDSSFTRFLDYTQRRTTVGRTPLDE